MGNDASTQKIPNDINVTWKKFTRCSFQPREGQSCASIGNKLYIFGGVICSSENEVISNHESNQLLCFDTGLNQWQEIKAEGKIPEPRSGSTLASVGHNLYLFGGLSEFSGWQNDFYAFNTETNTWSELSTSIGNPPSPRDKLSCSVIDHNIYYFGGFGPDPSGEGEEEIIDDDGDEDYVDEDLQEVQQVQNAANFTWFNDVYKFNTQTRVWSKIVPQNQGAPPTPRAAHTMSVISDNLLVFGGRDSESRQNDLWAFSTTSLQWEECKSTGYRPEPRSFHAAVSAGKRLVVCGGRSITNEHFGDFHIYDFETKQWFQPEMVEADSPPSMGMHSLCVVGDKIVLYGGTSHLDPVTNSCTQYFSDCFGVELDDILKGGAVINQKADSGEEKKVEAVEGGEPALPEFLNLKRNSNS